MSQSTYSWSAVSDVIHRQAVLYVDDEEPNRIIFQASFEPDFVIISAESGEAALEILRHQRVDVLVTDHRMPGISGVELCEIVRDRHPEVQRVLVTAYTDLATATTAINRGGVSHYITKPWDVDELRAILDQSLANAVLSRTARMLQSTMLMKERLAGVAATRGRILHDLANLSLVISVTSSNLMQMMEQIAGSIPAQAHADILDELHDQRTAVKHLQDLHTRVRNLRAADSTHPMEQKVKQLFSTVRVLTRGQIDAVTVHVDCPDDATFYADPTDAARVLVNLITNAAQSVAGVPEPQITLSAQTSEDHVDILVTDNGPGIPEHLQDQIFQGFFTTRSSQGGNGLGLAICVELAQSNRGSVTLRESHPGGTTTFQLRLPSSPPAPPPPTP